MNLCTESISSIRTDLIYYLTRTFSFRLVGVRGIVLGVIQGVFFSKGPTQKSSKYGIGPSQQDKIAKYTGPTQSYQMSELLTNNFCCQKNYCFVELQSFQSYTHFITMVRVWTVRQRTFLVERKLKGADLAQIIMKRLCNV